MEAVAGGRRPLFVLVCGIVLGCSGVAIFRLYLDYESCGAVHSFAACASLAGVASFARHGFGAFLGQMRAVQTVYGRQMTASKG